MKTKIKSLIERIRKWRIVGYVTIITYQVKSGWTLNQILLTSIPLIILTELQGREKNKP